MSNGTRPFLFLLLIVALLVTRQVGEVYNLYHFQPYIALFFALAALKKWQWLAVPAAGYLISTIVAVGGVQLWMLSPILTFALIAMWGKRFSPKSSTPNMLAGSLIGATIFYLITNTYSWLASPLYAKSFAGLTQALWSGTPGYAPTWTFFRNDAIATVLFTAMVLVLNRMTFGKAARPRLDVSQLSEA